MFEAGDRVYCPARGTRIYTVSDESCIGISVDGMYFREDGTFEGSIPQIFLATRINQKRLSEFYGLEFEEPLTVHYKILESIANKVSVICYVSDSDFMETNTVAVITDYSENSKSYIDNNEDFWKYATPIALGTDRIFEE